MKDKERSVHDRTIEEEKKMREKEAEEKRIHQRLFSVGVNRNNFGKKKFYGEHVFSIGWLKPYKEDIDLNHFDPKKTESSQK